MGSFPLERRYEFVAEKGLDPRKAPLASGDGCAASKMQCLD